MTGSSRQLGRQTNRRPEDSGVAVSASVNDSNILLHYMLGMGERMKLMAFDVNTVYD